MNQKGFTLIECMVAVVILGLCALPIASYFASAVRLQKRETILFQAGNAADDVLLLVTEAELPAGEDPSFLLRSYTEQGLFTELSMREEAFSFRYQNYLVLLWITDCGSFWRVDVELQYVVNDGDQFLRKKGVIRHASDE